MRFYSTVTNRRGNTKGSSVESASVSGWDAGVRVVPVGVNGKPDD